MSETPTATLPVVTPEQRQVTAGQFDRANQVISTGKNLDYGIQLLTNCCKIDPGNLIYRQALRRAQKTKHNNNLRGNRMAFLTTSATRTRLKSAKGSHDYLRVLELGEDILIANPWDTGTQLDMADAAENLGLRDVAIWMLEQARQKDAKDGSVNRALARLYEKRGNFGQAISLWELIRKADPTDAEAQHKAKDLAASDTIARGNYQAAIDASKEAAEEPSLAPAEPQHFPTTASEERMMREVVTLRGRISSDPTNPNGYLQLAAFHRRANQWQKAKEVLEEALPVTGHPFDLTIELADVEIEPFRQNLLITEEKLKATPQDEELRKIRIRLLKEINSREMDIHRQKADRYPTEMSHRMELGVRLLRAGQTDAAIMELQAARNDPRVRWRALQFLGHCFKSRNNWRLAQRNFEEALQTIPSTEESMRKEIMFQLAQGAAEAGDLTKAVDMAYELANIDFGYKEIGRLLDEWQARLQEA